MLVLTELSETTNEGAGQYDFYQLHAVNSQ